MQSKGNIFNLIRINLNLNLIFLLQSSRKIKMMSYKVVLFGMSGVGKTEFINKINGNLFESKHYPSLGYTIHLIRFNTNIGSIIEFEVWDGYPISLNAEACIGIMDTSKISRKIVHEDYEKIGGNLPVVFIVNKCETKQNHSRLFPQKAVFMSVKDNINVELPLLILARQLCNNPNLLLTEQV